jgi:Alpha-tubulin suppressor and related RCC1 domain-containing proteins
MRIGMWLKIIGPTLTLALALGAGGAGAQSPAADDALLAPVAADGGVRSIASGYGHSCAVSGRGNVWCWGYNLRGQLGIGATTDELEPQRVVIDGRVIQVSLGSVFSCALTSAGNVFCWGFNGHGELGNQTNASSSVPVRVALPNRAFRQLAVGVSHACAIDDRDRLWCWGDNVEGQLGDGTIISRSTPFRVLGVPGPITSVGAGIRHTCAIGRQGRVWCWGSNFRGQVGDGTTTNRRSPVEVPAMGRFNIAVAPGGHSTCAINRRNFLSCWGANDTGQLGNGTFDTAHLPQRVTLSERFRSVSVGASSVTGTWVTVCGVTRFGDSYCWGNNNAGQLGIGQTEVATLPQQVTALGADVRGFSVAHNGENTCAINAAGIAFCWGDNSFGQLGDGTETNASLPVRVNGRLHSR